MKQLLIVLATMLTLTAGCAGAGSEQLVEPATTDSVMVDSELVEPNQEEVAIMPEETLSAELQQAVLEAVGEQQNVPPDQLEITAIDAADWPDACLGITTPDVFCAQVITPGWAITITDGQTVWQYRTDLDVMQVKLADTK